jgi:hypothetical protein
MGKELRKFRIRYPKYDRPLIKIEGFVFEVMDLSASGVKFKGKVDLKLHRVNDYFVEIITVSGGPVQTKAKFARRVGDLFALAFIKHISDAILEKEYKRLEAKFGKVDIGDQQ